MEFTCPSGKSFQYGDSYAGRCNTSSSTAPEIPTCSREDNCKYDLSTQWCVPK